MRRTAILPITAALVLTGCSNETQGQASPASTGPSDGTQNYQTVEAFYAAVNEAGADCGDLEIADSAGLIATAQGACPLGRGRLLLQLWDDATDRDDSTSDIIINLSSVDYCFVLGRGEGEEGAWSINAGADFDVCDDLSDALGGEVFDSRSDSSTSTAPTTAAPTTAAPPPPAPEQFSGVGTSVVTFTATDPRVVTITHDGSSNFAVFSVDARGQDIDLLVNEIGSYSGVLPLNFVEGEDAAALRIEADGAWSVVSAPLTSAPLWDGLAPYVGSGDGVLLVNSAALGGLTPVNITHDGDSNFAVFAYGDSRDLLINEIGAYTGQILIPTGTLILTVNADGPWSIARA